VPDTPATFHPAQAAARVLAQSLRPLSITPPPGTVSLGLGEPDFPTPQPIIDAAAQALRDGYTRYADWNGDPELCAVIAATHAAAPAGYGPRNVVVTNGSTAAIVTTVMALVDAGDRVVVVEPTYSLYADAARLVGAQVVHVPTTEDYHLDVEALRRAATGARLIIVCSPGNPTGAVLRFDELAAVAEIAEGAGAWVLADEAYCDLVYEPFSFTPAAAVPGLADRLVVCRTLSKTYAMTGWRIGYALAPEPVASAMRVVHRTFNGSVNSAVQRAAIVAISGGRDLAAPMLAEYAVRRDFVVERIGRIPSLQMSEPEGAFYAFPRYTPDIASRDLVERLLAAGVSVRPGDEFGPSGEGRIRIAFSAGRADLAIGLDRIEAVLDTLG